jgi:hypothetical protein
VLAWAGGGGRKHPLRESLKKERRQLLGALKRELAKIRGQVLKLHDEEEGYMTAEALEDAAVAIEKAIVYLDVRLNCG